MSTIKILHAADLHLDSPFQALSAAKASIRRGEQRELLARLAKTPATVFYITALVPMIPGGLLYRTMDAALSRNWENFISRGSDTLYTTLGLAAGLGLVSGILHLFLQKKKKI